MLVELYSYEGCSFCADAKNLLERRGYRYLDRDIKKNSEWKAELLRRAPSVKTVPQIFVGTSHIGGYSDLQRVDREGILQQMIGGE